MLALILTQKDVWVALEAGQGSQYFQCRSAENYDFRPGLAVGQAEAAVLEIDVFPPQRQNFRFPAASKHQKPDRRQAVEIVM